MTYIIKSEKDISFYYYSSGKILSRKRNSEGLSPETTIARDVRSDFTLSLSDSGEAYIFCRDNMGNVLTIKNDGNGYTGRTILENKSGRDNNALYFDARTNGSSMDLIYNVPTGGKGNNDIYFQSLGKEKSAPVLMDSVFALRNDIYRVCTVGGIRVVSYFRNKQRLSLCYREVMEQSIGPLNTVFSSGGAFTDYSVFGSKDGMYFSAVLTNVFSSRLLFRKRTAAGFSDAVPAAEMNMINSPLIFSHNNRINIFFRSGSRAYITSENGRPTAFSGKICEKLARACYADISDGSEIKASEAPVNADKPWDIQIYPEISESYTSFISDRKPRRKEYSDYNFMDFFTERGSDN